MRCQVRTVELRVRSRECLFALLTGGANSGFTGMRVAIVLKFHDDVFVLVDTFLKAMISAASLCLEPASV